MARVIVLRAGYARPLGDGRLQANGTITLIQGKHDVMVDTGLPGDRQALIDLLKAEGLTPTDVDVVVCTHGHSDHVGNNNLFPDALFVVCHDVSRGDLYTPHDFATPYEIDDEVRVVATPGHTSHDVSVIVQTASGVVVVAGDLFENEDDQLRDDRWLAASEDPSTQRRTRASILAIADFVVPGHGRMFRSR